MKTGVHYKTATSILSKLKKKGLVRNPRRGWWRIKPIQGVGSVADLAKAPRIQNFTIQAEGWAFPRGTPDYNWGIKEGLDDPRNQWIRIQFGSKRKKITAYLSSELGYDLYGLRLGVRHVEMVLESLGILVPENWKLLMLELLNDSGGFKLEGLNCATWRDLDGNLEKYYNKDGKVRREVRGRMEKGASLDSFMALYQSGMSAYQVAQGVIGLQKDMRIVGNAVIERQGFDNIMLTSQGAILTELKKIAKILDNKGGSND